MNTFFKLSSLALTLGLSLAAATALAQNTPVGTWKTVDDKTGEAKAEIVIADKGGALVGHVDKGLGKPADEPNCTLCTDDRKGKAKIGLEIIRGAVKHASKNEWVDGNILDPENGKIYDLRMTPIEGGKKLQVRGYIGPFYRTQVWLRVK